MDEAAITIRIGDRARVSKDSGESCWLDEAHTSQLRNSILAGAPSLVQEAGNPTACTLATIGEGAQIRPVSGDADTKVDEPDGRDGLLQIGHITLSKSRALKAVLDSRYSAHDLGPVDLDELATVVVRSGRMRDWTDLPDGFQVTHRPVPSAGGRHPCSLLIAGSGVDKLEDGWWLFDPRTCSLTAQTILPPVRDFLEQQQVLAAFPRSPAAAVVVIADFRRTLRRYPAGTVHVWRDAGALLATLHLCATDIGLRSCITGGVDMLDSGQWDDLTTDVGAVLLGR